MNNKEKFIKEVESFKEKLSDEAKEYLEELKKEKNKIETKKTITDKGKIILKDMQENVSLENNCFKSKEIGERLGLSGRSVSGSIRSLITLGYVEKISTEPVKYGLTQLGKDFHID